MVKYVLTTPLNVGGLNPVTVSELAVDAVYVSRTPQLGPLGSGDVAVVLKDANGTWTEEIAYTAPAIDDLWTSPASAGTLGDVLASIMLNQLVNDGKLPPGSIVTA